VVEAAGYADVNALNWLLRQGQDLAGAAPVDHRRG